MIKGIVSDLDGTLIDTAKILAKAWEEAFRTEDLEIGYDELYKNTKGLNSRDLVRKYKKDSTPDDLIRIKGNRKNNFLSLINSNFDILYPETLKFLEDLRRKSIKIAIGTGLSHDLLKKIMEITGLDRKIDAVVSSDDVENGKPMPDVFLEAFHRINVEPKKGMVIGDSDNDILPGKRIGSFTVFISREGLESQKADANITNLAEALKFL